MIILAVPFVMISLIVTIIVMIILEKWVVCILLLGLMLLLNEYSELFAYKRFFNFNKSHCADFSILSLNANRAYSFLTNMSSSEEFINAILDLNADVVLFQEFNTFLYSYICDNISEKYPYTNSNVNTSRYKSIFSKYPIEEESQLVINRVDERFGVFQNELYCGNGDDEKKVLPICKMMVNVNGHKIQLYNCHLMSNNFSVEIRKIKERRSSIYNFMCSIFRRLSYGYRCRKVQVMVLLESIEEDIPAVICGDFNDVGGSPIFRILKRAGFKDAWWYNGLGYGTTYSGMGMRLRLDHILFAPQKLKINSVNILNLHLSDHNPIMTTFIFK